MTTSTARGRVTFRLILLGAVIALVAVIMSTARATDDSGAAAQPVQTGSFKIIKTHPGFPQSDVVDDMFQFDVVCDDADGYTVTYVYPNDFTGAQVQDPTELPLDTACVVTETILSAASSLGTWEVETDVEAGNAFIPQNPRTVTIDNASGNNTIRFRNTFTPLEPEPASFTITKEFNPPSAADGTEFFYAVECRDAMGDVLFSAVVGPLSSHGEQLTVEGVGVPHVGDTCTASETGPGGGPLPDGWTVSPSGAQEITLTGDTQNLTFVNTPDPVDPEPARLVVTKDFVGGTTTVEIGVVCNLRGQTIYDQAQTLTADGTVSFDDIPAGAQCVVIELFPNGDLTNWATSIDGSCGTRVEFSLQPGQTAEIDIVNTLPDYSITSTCPLNQNDD